MLILRDMSEGSKEPLQDSGLAENEEAAFACLEESGKILQAALGRTACLRVSEALTTKVMDTSTQPAAPFCSSAMLGHDLHSCHNRS